MYTHFDIIIITSDKNKPGACAKETSRISGCWCKIRLQCRGAGFHIYALRFQENIYAWDWNIYALDWNIYALDWNIYALDWNIYAWDWNIYALRLEYLCFRLEYLCLRLEYLCFEITRKWFGMFMLWDWNIYAWDWNIYALRFQDNDLKGRSANPG